MRLGTLLDIRLVQCLVRLLFFWWITFDHAIHPAIEGLVPSARIRTVQKFFFQSCCITSAQPYTKYYVVRETFVAWKVKSCSILIQIFFQQISSFQLLLQQKKMIKSRVTSLSFIKVINKSMGKIHQPIGIIFIVSSWFMSILLSYVFRSVTHIQPCINIERHYMRNIMAWVW